MSVVISNYSKNLVQIFNNEKERLIGILGQGAIIEHVGSSSVGIGGKNIVDILVGVPDEQAMRGAKETLISAGYFAGKDNRPDKFFLASRKGETGKNDIHIHICRYNSNTFRDFITLRNYLRAHSDIAYEYFEEKKKIATLAKHDRKEYKRLKSGYVSRLLDEARKEKRIRE